MDQLDDFTDYYSELLGGKYDSVDRIVLNHYFSMGQRGGGFRIWWRQLHGTDTNLTQKALERMAQRFGRRCWAWAKANNIHIEEWDKKKEKEHQKRKHDIAHEHMPQDPDFVGVFLVLATQAPGKIYKVANEGTPNMHLTPKWSFVRHYCFHIMDPEWGHITVKMCAHPPFGGQIILNGHEWVERQARKEGLEFAKEDNCFTASTDFAALDRIADTLNGPDSIGRLSEVCERWIYIVCLRFGLSPEELERSGFRFDYSSYQTEYSRNLLFTRGRHADQVFQGVIDRTRRLLDLRVIKTIFGRHRRPYHRKGSKRKPRLGVTVEKPTYDLTVFKVHFGRLTLKLYTKGACGLRIEVVVHNTKELKCGKELDRLPEIVSRMQDILLNFLNVLCYAHLSFLDEGALDELPTPTQLGSTRVAGINLDNRRLCTVVEALLPLGPSPTGFTVGDLADRVRELTGWSAEQYKNRQASYDLKKIRAKSFVEPIGKSRRYRFTRPGFETLAGAVVLREKVIKPVLAGVARPYRGRRPKRPGTIDYHYERLHNEMQDTLGELGVLQ